MGFRWNPIRFHFFCFLFFIVSFQIRPLMSLNSEGFALLKFRERIDADPHGTLENWNADDETPCSWSCVHCVDGKVQMLDLSVRSLRGTLSRELAKLSDLRSLILYQNHLLGGIPREFGAFTRLELLDLRDNSLSGKIPLEIGRISSLKRLLLCDNKFEGSIPEELGRLASLSEFQFDESLELSAATGLGCTNRKLGHCIWLRGVRPATNAEAFTTPIQRALDRYFRTLPLTTVQKESLPDRGQNYNANFPSSFDENGIFLRRRLLEDSRNLQAAPVSGDRVSEMIPQAFQRSSGAFPAVPNAKKRPAFSLAPSPFAVATAPNPSNRSFQKPKQTKQKPLAPGNVWFFVIIAVASVVALFILVVVILLCRQRAAKTIGPWKTGLSGQLQKAFVTGVPKLKRSELETACEDFSNIIQAFDGYTVYKGTLSSGVEIAVASTAISSANEWSKAMEMAYRRKIDTLSRINHKNFVNLIGYCEEDEPFNRMMVFEYAPSGTLFEHLHGKEMEHLDWNARMRIIMGTAYCLQYMHDLNPPVAHSILCSLAVYLTDDYAAKVAEVCFNTQTGLKQKTSRSGELEHSVLPPLPEPETNVHSFGILLLEIISGRLPYTDEDGSIEKWASQHLNDETLHRMVDPTLKSFKHEELEVICNVIRECTKSDPRQRPTMKDVVSQLKEAINISPDQATPRLSPLWWAELEILSSEAN